MVSYSSLQEENKIVVPNSVKSEHGCSLIGAMTFFNRTKGEQSYSFGLIQGVFIS